MKRALGVKPVEGGVQLAFLAPTKMLASGFDSVAFGGRKTEDSSPT